MTAKPFIGPIVLAALVASACGDPAPPARGGPGLNGALRVDGSSTVYPITEAVAEEFQEDYPGVRVTVAISGTTGGFRKFCQGEADISDASRAIKLEELEICRANGIEPLEIIVGFDGISLVVHPDNTFVDCLSTGELRRIWRPGSRVETWRDVRPGWPAAGTPSATSATPITWRTRNA